MKTTSKKSAKGRASVARVKEGQKVTYDGKKFTVKRAYEYKGRPFCILTSNTVASLQVSANSVK